MLNDFYQWSNNVAIKSNHFCRISADFGHLLHVLNQFSIFILSQIACMSVWPSSGFLSSVLTAPKAILKLSFWIATYLVVNNNQLIHHTGGWAKVHHSSVLLLLDHHNNNSTLEPIHSCAVSFILICQCQSFQSLSLSLSHGCMQICKIVVNISHPKYLRNGCQYFRLRQRKIIQRSRLLATRATTTTNYSMPRKWTCLCSKIPMPRWIRWC